MAVGPINVPNFGSFTPDITPTLANLVNTINQGQKQQTLADLGKGLADGTLDYRQAAGKLASTGNLNGVVSLLQLNEAERKRKAGEVAGQQFGQSLSSLYGGGALTGTPTASASPSGGYSDAIAGIESGGKYDVLGPVTRTGDRAYGKYQVMGQNIGPWTQEVLGRAMTPQEFVANPQAQDAVFQAKFGNYVQKYGPEGAARAWFAGEGGMNDLNRKDQLGTSVSNYGQRFMANLRDGELPVNAQPTQGVLPQAAPHGVGQLSPRGFAMMRALGDPNLPAGQREVAKTLLGAELDGMKLTNNQKEYAMYRAEGGTDNFTDWLRGNKAAGAINIDQRAETAEAKAAGDAAGKRRGEMFAAAGSAGKTLTNLSRMEGLLNQVSQGKLQPARMNISAWAKSFGLNDEVAKSLGLDPKGVGSAQAVQSLINESVVGKIGAGGFPANNFSDADREFITKIFPSLGDDPRANKIRIEGARRMAKLDIERAKAFQQFKANPANKGRGFEDFELDWSEKMAQRDVFGDLRREAESIIGAPRDDIGGTISNPGAAPSPSRGASGSWGNQQPQVQGARQASDGKFYVPDPNRPGKYLEVR